MGAGPTSPRPPGGTVGDRYDLVAELGSGGMGTVWRARDRVLDRFVAVKLFARAAAGTDPADQSRATREARVLAQLNHPNLVAVLDAGGESPERLDHLVMELVGGPTLRDRIRRGTLRPDAVLRLGAELAAGLAYVHDRGVVHRDLKPANILFDSDDDDARPKIADFGIARLLSAAPLTSTGMLVGTATYLSPEQALGQRVGTSSDVYSLGVVLLECLTGTPAYEGQGVEAVAARLHRDPDVTPVQDPRTRALLAALTARDPEARPDARTAADAFDALAAGDVDRFDRLGIGVPPGRPGADAAAGAPTRIETAGTEALAVTAVRGAVPTAMRTSRTVAEPASRRGRVVLLALAGVLLLGLVVALGVGLLGSSGGPTTTDPSGPTAVIGGDDPSPSATATATKTRSASARPSSASPSASSTRTATSTSPPTRSTSDDRGSGPTKDTGPKGRTPGAGPGDDPPGTSTDPKGPGGATKDDKTTKGPAARP